MEALAEEFGRERVIAKVRETIVKIAEQQGQALAAERGNSLVQFSASLENWKKDDALEIRMIEESEGRLSYDVTRCRYAEMYQALGIPELGAVLSCNRDFAFAAGFNPSSELTRTQTILGGASHCDFRFVDKASCRSSTDERPFRR